MDVLPNGGAYAYRFDLALPQLHDNGDTDGHVLGVEGQLDIRYLPDLHAPEDYGRADGKALHRALKEHDVGRADL